VENDGGGSPQLFETVVGAFSGGEDVDNDVTVVYQYPARLADALAVQRRCTFFIECVKESISDSFGLALASGRTNDEVIGNGCQIVDVEQDDIVSLFIREDIDNSVCKLR
jgi:hypothetical protein